MSSINRKFTEPELIVATHNAGKLREISALIEPFGVTALSAGELGLPEPVEDGETFIANALIKARAAAIESGKPALADDSGLCVEALNGDPGIFSARWAGEDKDFGHAMEAVHQALSDMQAPTPHLAHFTCALALVWPDGDEVVFEGKVHGSLTWPMRGARGFGYDPIFIANGMTETFAEIDPAHKHAISHRADAFNQMVKACFE